MERVSDGGAGGASASGASSGQDGRRGELRKLLREQLRGRRTMRSAQDHPSRYEASARSCEYEYRLRGILREYEKDPRPEARALCAMVNDALSGVRMSWREIEERLNALH